MREKRTALVWPIYPYIYIVHTHARPNCTKKHSRFHFSAIRVYASAATGAFNKGAIKSMDLHKSILLLAVFAVTAILLREYSHFVFPRYQIDYLLANPLILKSTWTEECVIVCSTKAKWCILNEKGTHKEWSTYSWVS